MSTPGWHPAVPDQATYNTNKGYTSATGGNSPVPGVNYYPSAPSQSVMPNAPSWWGGANSYGSPNVNASQPQGYGFTQPTVPSPIGQSILSYAPSWYGGATTSSYFGWPAGTDMQNWYYNGAGQDQVPTTAAGGGNGGGGGGGGATTPAPITWSEFDSGIANAPDWWKAMKPSDITPNSEWLASMNMMIPFLSPEDQKTVAATLFQQDPETFNYLGGMAEGSPQSTDLTGQQRAYWQSSTRAKDAMDALGKLAAAVGRGGTDFGPGYEYLRTVLQTMGNFGGGGNMANQQTRRQQMNMFGALDPLLGQSSGTGGDLSAYGPLVKALSNPYFSAGQTYPMTKSSTTGTYQWGLPNAQLM